MANVKSLLLSVKKFLGLSLALPPYAECPRGIDVSSWQGPVDWHKAKAAGVRFAGIRCSIGLSVDTRFAENWAGAKAAGIARTAYFVPVTVYTVEQQVGKFVGQFPNGYDGELPPAIDYEVENTPASMLFEAGGMLATWISGSPIIYSRAEFLNRYVGKDVRLRSYWLWLAQYLTTAGEHPGPVILPDGATWAQVIIHQTTSHGDGKLHGTTSLNVDLDRWIWGEQHYRTFVKQEEPQKPMATPYDNYALGLALDIGQTCDLQAAKEAGFSFVSQVYASDFNVNQKWADIVQDAYNAELPIMAEVVPYMAAVGYSQGKLAESYWNQHEYRYVDQAANGVNRKIAGIIVSAEVRDDGSGVTVTESNTQATLEYLLNNYRAQLDARGKTKVKVMLRSNDSYIQAIAPTAIPSIVEREQFHDYVMADWRYRLEDASGRSSYGPFVGGAAPNAADIRAGFGRLPIGFKTPPYPGNLYFWEVGKWWTLPFVTGKARIFMAYGKTEAQLYEDIGFGAVTPPIDPPPPPPVVDTDLAEVTGAGGRTEC